MSEAPQTSGSSQLPLAIFVVGIVVIGIAVLLGVLLSSGSGDGSDDPEVIVNNPTVTIDIQDFAYGPANVSIQQGAAVIWNNLDRAQHDARQDDEDWTTPLLEEGGSAARNFDIPGTFNYHCSIHPYMKGTITVRPVASEQATGTPAQTVAQ